MTSVKRPSTAPANKSSTLNRSQISSFHSTSTTRLIKRQYKRSARSHVSLPPKTAKSTNLKYRHSTDIRTLTKGLLLDILPAKFQPLHKNKKFKKIKTRRSSLMSNISNSRPKTNYNYVKKLESLSPQLSTRSHYNNKKRFSLTKSKSSSSLRVSTSIPLTARKQKPKSKNIMTAYEKYQFMDQVHDLYFELQEKEKFRQDLLKKIAENEENIEIEEELRKRVLDESLRIFPNNHHLILARAEGNWLNQTKIIKNLYKEHIRKEELRQNEVNEYYTTAKSTKIKECVIRLTKKYAKLRSKYNQHLRSLNFDENEIYQISQQITEYEDMMNNIFDVELFSNNVENKLNLIQKQVEFQSIINEQNKNSLNDLLNDVQRRIYENDDNEDDILKQIKSFCNGDKNKTEMIQFDDE